MSDVIRRGNEYLVVLAHDEPARVGDCRDCFHLRGAVSWWCRNQTAAVVHGTLLPGRKDCQFWSEARRESVPAEPLVPGLLQWVRESLVRDRKNLGSNDALS